jgi:hypothetical protein
VLQAGYDLVEIPAFNADKLDGECLQSLCSHNVIYLATVSIGVFTTKNLWQLSQPLPCLAAVTAAVPAAAALQST